MKTTIDVEALLDWGEPRTVNTRKGERVLRTAKPTEDFWKAWKSDNDALREAGVGCGKDRKTGSWEACWWSTPDKAEAEAALKASWADDSSIDIPVPDGLSYLPYQRGGIAYAIDRERTLIADEMGLGKTVQALGVANLIGKQLNATSGWDRTLQLLIICPASLKGNWRNEAIKWLTDDLLDVATVEDGKDVATVEEAAVVIVNYELAIKPAIAEALRKRRWDLLVADEAHLLKNPKAQRTKRILGAKSEKGIVESADKVLFLSGTPLLSKPIELWPLVKVCANGVLGGWQSYVRTYCDGYSGQWGWVTDGASNLDELQVKLRRSFMVRRLKKDVLKDLPAKRRQVIELPPTHEIKRALKAETREWELHEDTLASLRARAALADENEDEQAHRDATRQLQEAQNVAFHKMAEVRKLIAVAKLPLAIQHLQEMLDGSDGKVIVFAHHHEVIDGLLAGLKDYNPQVIDGRTPQKDRTDIVDRFQTSTVSRVFIGGLKAAGVGLTLTAADTVVFVELDWTPAINTQAEDRAHRIGQQNCVLVQHLVCEGSLDSKVAKDCVHKQDVIDGALDTGATKGVLPSSWEGIDQPAPKRVPSGSPASGGGSKRKPKSPWKGIGEQMSETQKALALRCIRSVAADDADRASALNGVGFSKIDSHIGNELAGLSQLTDAQAAIARHLALKYRKQLDQRLWEPLQQLDG